MAGVLKNSFQKKIINELHCIMHVFTFNSYYLDLLRFKVHLPIFIKLYPEFSLR